MTDAARALNQLRIHLRGVDHALDEMLELKALTADNTDLFERGIEDDMWVVLTRLHDLYVAMRHRYLN